ncbi:prolyl oligopeptidase family serine peptidase [Rufibacter sp. XAAS-G3-1]|uniref:S9 family peptidase n=1 Tax=Rufibacter sp. XAAS-G3-1 TaxID=2729134 RepID=UPI0015E7E0CB|nr:prolyl oligopeptidase family serine peptidase [Rufibacter sp. XAAS-G3-1]
MKKLHPYILLFLTLLLSLSSQAQTFSFEQVKSYPFPTALTSSQQGSRIAWAIDEQGKRNIYVAEGPKFTPRRLTNYLQDDGQELTSISLSPDGQWVVYVRGGDHGSNWNNDLPVNTSFSPVAPKVQIWTVPFAGGEPKAIGEGANPVISPKGDRMSFTRNAQVWVAPLDGSAPAKQMFSARGSVGSLEWSPSGEQLVFVSNRGDHAFIGVFTNEQTPLNWIAPSFTRDRNPRWSPDGKRLVFVRTQGTGGAPDSILAAKHQPWSIWTAEVATGKATKLWEAPKTLAGSVPGTHGGVNLHWAANDRIVFLSSQDNWPHLYSIPSTGGNALLLTPGNLMAEHIRLSSDKKWLVFSANAGPDKLDIDRRHVARVPVDKAAMEILTPGTGLEWTPVVTGDGNNILYFSASAQRPALLTSMPFKKGKPTLLGENLVPTQFPTKQLVTPKQVTFKAPDGTTIHGQLFEPKGGGKKPAIVYVHGGPSRQMLLGWNYSEYYSNVYALNQYLTKLGFVVLSVNYRLGIGYGYDFQNPKNANTKGNSEYQDIKAAGEWLAKQPQVDASRIGIYGGSYGGYLAAMALAKDSKLFAAGVDIHGVHDRTVASTLRMTAPDRYERAPDADLASKVAWQSSVTAYMDTWTSPVLIIHGDDDRNVQFSQSTDLVRRLEAKGVPYETLVIVDDTHHWMSHGNALKVGLATADFFQRKLMKTSNAVGKK